MSPSPCGRSARKPWNSSISAISATISPICRVSPPAAAGNCHDARTLLGGNAKSTVFSRELRFNTPRDSRLRSNFGVFFSDTEILELNDFTYLSSAYAESFTPGAFGFAPNYPLPGAWRQDPGPFPEGVVFRNDIRRTDEQYGAFAEASWELIPDTLRLTAGIRNYEIDVDLEGSANAPGFQASLRLRYEWRLDNGRDAWVMSQLSHSGSSWSDIVLINRIEQEA